MSRVTVARSRYPAAERFAKSISAGFADALFRFG